MARMPIQKYVYSSSSSVVRQRCALPMREDTSLQPLSPYGVTKLAGEHLGHLYFANHGVSDRISAVFTVYGPRSGTIWRSSAFSRPFEMASQSPYMVMASRRVISLHLRYRRRQHRRGCAGAPGQRIQYWWWRAGHVKQVLELLQKVTGKTVAIQREPEQKGDMRHTYADTSAARRRISISTRGSASRTGLRPAISVAYDMKRFFSRSPLLLALSYCHGQRMLVETRPLLPLGRGRCATAERATRR